MLIINIPISKKNIQKSKFYIILHKWVKKIWKTIVKTHMMTKGELHKLGVIGFEFEKIYDERQYKHIS